MIVDLLLNKNSKDKNFNATSGFYGVELCNKNLKRKCARRLYENAVKVALENNITSWKTERMTISKLSRHIRRTKLKFSVTVLTLDLEATPFRNTESFGGNSARAPHLTAVWFKTGLRGTLGKDLTPTKYIGRACIWKKKYEKFS